MAEDISVQILAQASENIQKLFDLSTRIDERVKTIQSKQDHLDRRLDDLMQRQIGFLQTIAVLEQLKEQNTVLFSKLENSYDEMNRLDKRLMHVEGDTTKNSDRWKQIGTFIIQLIWVILAAYLLTKLNLQAPAVP